MNTPDVSHSEFLQNVPYQLLSNDQDTLNILEFRVLVEFGIRHIIRPKVDGGFHRRSQKKSPYTFVLYASIENVALVAEIPNF